MKPYTSIELCTGAGGQALGLEQAGFKHLVCVEFDSAACATLRLNRQDWNVIEGDLRKFSANSFKGAVDLVAAGVPCPPFSKAGKQLGQKDDRDLFPDAIRIVKECRPRAVMIENVRGLMDPIFQAYRSKIERQLKDMGYRSFWKLLNASDYGVPQLRPRFILVALRESAADYFAWPKPNENPPATVGEALLKEMASKGWRGAKKWAQGANDIAPTLVGGSKKHGGPDLGLTRAKKAWALLGVNGHTIADNPPEAEFEGMPKLTVRMAATIQGFPPNWLFSGKKTPAYRQVGNAFPPPVAHAVGLRIADALMAEDIEKKLRSTMRRSAVVAIEPEAAP